jgi:PPE-repeat protein
MDYGAFPPEFNSARMYAGPGPESMLVGASAWNGLAAELRSVASSYESVISGLTDGSWLGPSSAAMEAAATPYVEWLNATAVGAEMTATQAQAAAGAYQTAFAMTVPPALIAENRFQLTQLVATNLLGQNTPAIAAAQAQYGEMWAQDAAAMYGYAAHSAAITSHVKPLTAAPETTNLTGLAAQDASTAGNATGAGTQSTLAQLISALTSELQSLSSPGSSSTGSGLSGLSGILSGLLGGSSSGTSTTGTLGGLSTSFGGIGESLLSNYLSLPGWMGMSTMNSVLGPLIGTPMSNAFSAAAAPAADVAAGAAGAAEGAADAAGGAAGAGIADLGGLAGVGEAASVGALAVPQSWGWAAAGLPATLGSVPLVLPGIDVGAAGGLPLATGLPMMMGGLPRAALAGAAGVVAGAAGAKYLPRLSVVARSPAAGYAAASAGPSIAKYPVPAGFPTNGHAPPGYQPAIVYLPTNGHEPANVDK